MSSSSPQDESDFTLAQQVAITLAPAFSCTLSLLGSSCIILDAAGRNRKKLKSGFSLLFVGLLDRHGRHSVLEQKSH
jgi:hypothetical protein